MIGAAALGLGVGVMQIPEEQRSGFQRRATLGLREAQDCVTSAGGHLSSNIITVCHKAGVDSSSVVPSTVVSQNSYQGLVFALSHNMLRVSNGLNPAQATMQMVC